MTALRNFLKTGPGKAAGIGLTVLAVGVMVYSIYSNLGDDVVTANSRQRIYICAKTGKSFGHTIKLGDSTPVESPHSGEKTGYPAELCYWTADGGMKTEPTPVLLNAYAGKTGPTFCPECKRLVVGQNPPAQAGMTPPPTEDQYAQSRKGKR